jgi:O-antigen ligase
MEPFDRRSATQPEFPGRGEVSYQPQSERSSGARLRTSRAYQLCDGATGVLICFLIVFTPWAFGSTQEWSIWTTNITCYALGALLLAKWLVSRQTGHRPARWKTESLHGKRDWLTISLAALSVIVLFYTLLSALNARAVYISAERRFEYFDCIRWLPHSYDRSSTWNALWNYAAFALFFWAARDWILGKTGRERHRRPEHDKSSRPVLALNAPGRSSSSVARAQAGLPAAIEHPAHRHSSHELPGRLRLLLWILCLNGAVLALEAILQRLSGTNKLLWLVVPHINSDPISQFGPYAYRANAATYFNLIWPISLGFWLVLRRSAWRSPLSGHRFGSDSHMVLLPCAVFMAACPIISTSRGGALIAVGNIMVTMAILLWCTRKEKIWLRLGTFLLFAIILGFSAYLGFKQLAPRFKTIFIDQMSQRTEIYENALPIAQEFPVFGTGPGTFSSLYQLYRDPGQMWHAYLHDDWLETRVTFGWIGFGLILLMLAMTVSRWFVGHGINSSWDFVAMLWAAIGGCMLHAKFDFPFQIHSIVILFLLLAAILFSLSRQPRQA